MSSTVDEHSHLVESEVLPEEGQASHSSHQQDDDQPRSEANNADSVERISDQYGFDPSLDKLPTILPASVAAILNVVMIFLVFFLPLVCEKSSSDVDHCPLKPFSILVYTHTILWSIHLIVDQFLKKKHKENRLRGYIEFYLKTKNLRRTPFYLVSVGNAVLLVTETALNDYCDVYGCKNKFTRVDYLRGLISLECLVMMFLWIRYIVLVRDFHSDYPLPDVLRPRVRKNLLMDLVDDSGMEGRRSHGHHRHHHSHPHSRRNSTHRRKHPRTKEDRDKIIEKQAEILRFLHHHIGQQNKEIIRLNHQLENAGELQSC